MFKIIDQRNFASPVKIGDFMIINSPIKANLLSDLENNYPPEEFFNRASGTTGKDYKFSIAEICNRNIFANDVNKFNPIWQDLLSDLFSDNYTALLSKMINIDLMHKPRSGGFYRLKQNDYVAIHLDKPHKILTQLFYFNPIWDRNFGGFLSLHNENNPDQPFLNLPPLSIYSIIILRTDNSWHSVSRVNSDTALRNSLQLEYWLE